MGFTKDTTFIMWVGSLLAAALLSAQTAIYFLQGRRVRRVEETVDTCFKVNAKTFATKEACRLQQANTGREIKELKEVLREKQQIDRATRDAVIAMKTKLDGFCPWDGKDRRGGK